MLLGFMVAQFVFSLPYNLLVYSIQWVLVDELVSEGAYDIDTEIVL